MNPKLFLGSFPSLVKISALGETMHISLSCGELVAAICLKFNSISTSAKSVCLSAGLCKNYSTVFRLDALAKALSVIATATWLGGWLAGWLSHSGTVSKPLNLSENFFDHLKAPSF